MVYIISLVLLVQRRFHCRRTSGKKGAGVQGDEPAFSDLRGAQVPRIHLSESLKALWTENEAQSLG